MATLDEREGSCVFVCVTGFHSEPVLHAVLLNVVNEVTIPHSFRLATVTSHRLLLTCVFKAVCVCVCMCVHACVWVCAYIQLCGVK